MERLIRHLTRIARNPASLEPKRESGPLIARIVADLGRECFAQSLQDAKIAKGNGKNLSIDEPYQ